MALSLEHITFDCTNAAALAGFWAALLDREVVLLRRRLRLVAPDPRQLIGARRS